PGPPGGRRPKADRAAEGGSAADQPGPLSWPGADPAARRYEALRAIALAGAGGGWRYQLPVLAARGMASWLAQEPAGPGPGDLQAAAMPQAGPSLSAPDPVLPGTSTNGGDARPPGRVLPAGRGGLPGPGRHRARPGILPAGPRLRRLAAGRQDLRPRRHAHLRRGRPV